MVSQATSPSSEIEISLGCVRMELEDDGFSRGEAEKMITKAVHEIYSRTPDTEHISAITLYRTLVNDHDIHEAELMVWEALGRLDEKVIS